MSKRLNKIFENSKRIVINNKSKIVIMCDCHRGNGNNYDDFVNNKNIFEAALKHYYKEFFLYVELGDGDEMWEKLGGFTKFWGKGRFFVVTLQKVFLTLWRSLTYWLEFAGEVEADFWEVGLGHLEDVVAVGEEYVATFAVGGHELVFTAAEL